jgi:hypothetical protein
MKTCDKTHRRSYPTEDDLSYDNILQKAKDDDENKCCRPIQFDSDKPSEPTNSDEKHIQQQWNAQTGE